MNSTAFFTPLDSTAERELAELARLERFSTLLDSAFTIPGTRFTFGIDSLAGLIPGIGDAAGAAASLYILTRAHQLGLPGHLKARMLGFIALDSVVGAIPLLGDLFDASFRSNRRMLRLIKTHLHQRHGLPVSSH